jgi:outer membrane receptor for ferrienterochelin and colicins
VLPLALFGQPKFVEKRLSADSSLLLNVINSQGQPLGVCQVSVHPIGNPQSFWFQTDSLSQVLIPHMLPSEIEVVPQNLAYLNQLFTLEIVPSGRAITLTLTNRDERIDPISITGAVNPQAISKTLYSVEVISSKKIAAMGAQSVDAVLQNQSNINISQDAVLGSGVQLQGMSGADVKILIDGVPMIGRLNGNIDLSQIPTHQIDRIEIVEGPMSVIYGSDAIGGLINIITRKPDQPGLRLDAHSYANSVGWRNFDANGQWKYKNWGLSGFAGRQFSY